MNTYRAFFNGKQKDVEAATPYDAQVLIAQQYRIKKTYNVTVVLLAVDDREVVHNGADFG